MITQAQEAVFVDGRQRAVLCPQPQLVKQLVPQSNQAVVGRVAFVGAAVVVAHGKNYTYIITLHCRLEIDLR